MELTELYQMLETKTDIKPISVSGLNLKNEQEKFAADMEYMVFLDIEKKVSICAKEKIPRIENYFNIRITETNNAYLLSRYFHFLYLLTHDKENCMSAVAYYKQIIQELATKTSEVCHLYYVFKSVLSLYSQQKQIIISEIKPLLTDLTKNGNNELKICLIQIIKDLKFYNAKDTEFIPCLCKELAVSNWKNYDRVKEILKDGILFAEKNRKLFGNLILELYEMLGDNEAQCINNEKGKEHNNQEVYKGMMEYYHKGKCQKKYEEAMKRYNECKQELPFIQFSVRIKNDPQEIELIENHYKQIMGYTTKDFLWYLVYGDSLVFVQDEILNKLVNKGKWYNTIAKTVMIDINGNEIPINENDPNMEKFQIITISLNKNLKIFISVILEAIRTQKITYTKTKNFLLQETYFGSVQTINRYEIELSYRWFEQIDYALKDLFKQMNLFLKQKGVDWRPCIDVLPAKFEGILREMIRIQGGRITKLGKDGKTSDALLDDLLRDKTFFSIFDKDDLNLFEYVFTSKGLNIRNDVAHGFYKPQDYTIEKAILVFMCIMRLAKYKQ